MQSIIEKVEDQSETKCSPANSQCYEDMGRCEDVSFFDSVHHSDVLSNLGDHQSHHCQADRDNFSIENRYLDSPDLKNEYDGVVTQLLDKFGLMRFFFSFWIHHILKIDLIEAELNTF